MVAPGSDEHCSGACSPPMDRWMVAKSIQSSRVSIATIVECAERCCCCREQRRDCRWRSRPVFACPVDRLDCCCCAQRCHRRPPLLASPTCSVIVVDGDCPPHLWSIFGNQDCPPRLSPVFEVSYYPRKADLVIATYDIVYGLQLCRSSLGRVTHQGFFVYSRHVLK